MLSQYTKVALAIGQCNSRSRLRSQHDSETTLATPRYSASALDRDIVGCRFEDHDIKLSPRNTQYPEVERRMSGQPPQSASDKTGEPSMTKEIGVSHNEESHVYSEVCV